MNVDLYKAAVWSVMLALCFGFWVIVGLTVKFLFATLGV